MKKITSKLLTAICLFFLIHFSYSQIWQTEGVSIDNITTNTSNQQLAIDSNNDNYILIHKTTQSKDFVLKYDGSSWNTLGPYIPDGTSEVTSARPHSITVNNNDDVFVAYVDPSLLNKVAVKKWNGTSWVYIGSNQGIAVNGSGISNITLKAFNNIVYITYFVPSFGIIVQVYNENTNTWDLVGGLNSISTSSGYLDLGIDYGGVPYVVYQDVSNNSFTTIKKFDGTNWVLVGNPISNFGTLQNIAFKSDDTPCITYYNGNNLSLVVKQFDGTSWINFGNSPGPTINPFNLPFTDLSMVLTGGDIPYIAYTENSTNELGKVITIDPATNDWIELPASNTPTGTGVKFNSIALDSQDVLHYAYLKSQVTKCVFYNATLSTNDLELKRNISLYPNPTKSQFSLQTNQPISEVSIYDVQGKMVKAFSSQLDTYDINGLTSGIYFVKIKNTDEGTVTKKLIKY